MKRVLILMLILILCGCGKSVVSGENTENAEIFMVNVGKADAIIVRADEDYYLIDTATEEMWPRVMAAIKDMNIARLKGVFVTHTDKDHVGGLEMLAQSDIQVDVWYASKYFIDVKEEKHPAVKAAKIRGQEVVFLGAGDSVDGIFEVLAPVKQMEDKDDNNSLVMILKTKNGSAFFAGDMEYAEENTILNKKLKADVLKVGNHADDDTTSQALIDKVDAKIALISTSSYEKPETPDPMLVERLENKGMEIFYTEHSNAGIRVTMDKNGVRAEYAEWKNAKPLPEGICIASVDPVEDTIVIENRSEKDADLSGFYLFSSKGKEILYLNNGCILKARGRIVIGSNSTQNTKIDLLWNDKNVINDTKADTITLNDPYGRAVCAKTANE
ncbi:MAG: MBL fold metallo-hydrolase [Clostridia bacterium]|nr:MBL fold metallo-hydrolase [Clostridia bacterium]